jgi:DNA-directed RNA polymerase specialized sigma54-like protein
VRFPNRRRDDTRPPRRQTDAPALDCRSSHHRNSARGIKAQIEKLVADEDSKNPLTDQAIVNILKQSGVQIARRTVAKYRDQLGVLSARMRKRV